MIVFLVAAGISLLLGVFALLPDVPEVSSEIVDMTDIFIDGVGNFAGLMNYLFSAPLFTASIVSLLVIFNFENVYHGIMWILRKIPVLGIK